MSIRFKVLLVLSLGMLVACSVSGMAYLNALRLDQMIDQIMKENLRSTRMISQSRESLREIRAFEREHLESWGVRHKDEVQEALYSLLNSLDEGPFEEEKGGNSFESQIKEISTLTEAYQSIFNEWGNYILSAEGERSMNASNLQLAGTQLGLALEILRPSLYEISESGIASQTSLNEVQARLLFAQLSSEATYWSDLSLPKSKLIAIKKRSFLNEMVRKQALLISTAYVLQESVLLPPKAAMALQKSVIEITERRGKLHEELLLETKAFTEIGQDLRQTRRKLEQSLNSLDHAHQRFIQGEQQKLSEQRSITLVLITIILIGGMAIVAVLGAVMSRGLNQSFLRILNAARAIQSGDLDARIQISSHDEISELGQAFNTMARYLKERRKQQVDYNDIVSLLNSTLSMRELLSGSLSEIIQRTGSAIGAFYIPDLSGENLLLAESFGFLGEGQHNRYRIGEGLVGQAARQRRKIMIKQVPEGMFPIDTGLGISAPGALLVLPIVHIERLLGVFVIGSSLPYSEDTLTFIEEVVFQVGVALNNIGFVDTIGAAAAELQDKTEELIAQRARLEQANSDLADANRLQSDFLANVTHELRTPLNSIIGFTELVVGRKTFDEKSKRHLSTVLRNATGLLSLINDLLDITKIEAGRSSLNLGRFDLFELVDECLQTISPLVDLSRVSLEPRIPEDLPLILSDQSRLKQVLLNLLSNATKFTEEGAIRVDVRLLPNDKIEIAVVDSGIGIHSEDLPHIFDKFRQVDSSTSRKYGGTGLGLTITSELVKLLNGTIIAKSEVGAGSTFILVFPLRIGAETREVESLPASKAPAPLDLDDPTPSAPFLKPIAPFSVHPPVGAVPGLRPVSLSQKSTQKSISNAASSGFISGQFPSLSSALKSLSSPSIQEPPREVATPSIAVAKPHRILVALDGNPMTIVTLREGLRNDSFEIKSAFICEDALHLFEESRPDVLLVGDPMPEDNYTESIASLQRFLQQQGTPVIKLGDSKVFDDLSGISTLGNIQAPVSVAAILSLLNEAGDA